MNIRQTIARWIGIVVGVILVGLSSTNLVLAAPYITPSHVSYRGISRRYAQSLAGRMPVVVYDVNPIDVRMRRLSAHEQYLAALEWMEQAHHDALWQAQMVDIGDHSGTRFEQYQWALRQGR